VTGHVTSRLARRRLHCAILATNTDSSASTRSDTPESRFPLFESHPNDGDTFNSFDFFNLDIFDFRRLPSKIQRLTILSIWRGSCLYRTCKNVTQQRGALCHWFSYSSAGGTSGTAFCGIARDSDCWIPCAMACGWRTAERKVLS
jgi:hypothetical protein